MYDDDDDDRQWEMADGTEGVFMWLMGLQGYDVPGLQSLSARCQEVCERVWRVADRAYPSTTALPLDHVALRLEQISAGLWPQHDDQPLTDAGKVSSALVQVCLRHC